MNVYRKHSSGGYQKYDNGSWRNVQQPTQAQKQHAQSQASSRRGRRRCQLGDDESGP